MDSLRTSLQEDVEKDVSTKRIRLHVQKGGTNEAIVTIEGIVTTFYQKQIIQEAVKRSCHRRDIQFQVINNLQVTQCPQSES